MKRDNGTAVSAVAAIAVGVGVTASTTTISTTTTLAAAARKHVQHSNPMRDRSNSETARIPISTANHKSKHGSDGSSTATASQYNGGNGNYNNSNSNTSDPRQRRRRRRPLDHCSFTTTAEASAAMPEPRPPVFRHSSNSTTSSLEIAWGNSGSDRDDDDENNQNKKHNNCNKHSSDFGNNHNLHNSFNLHNHSNGSSKGTTSSWCTGGSANRMSDLVNKHKNHSAVIRTTRLLPDRPPLIRSDSVRSKDRKRKAGHSRRVIMHRMLYTVQQYWPTTWFPTFIAMLQQQQQHEPSQATTTPSTNSNSPQQDSVVLLSRVSSSNSSPSLQQQVSSLGRSYQQRVCDDDNDEGIYYDDDDDDTSSGQAGQTITLAGLRSSLQRQQQQQDVFRPPIPTLELPLIAGGRAMANKDSYCTHRRRRTSRRATTTSNASPRIAAAAAVIAMDPALRARSSSLTRAIVRSWSSESSQSGLSKASSINSTGYQPPSRHRRGTPLRRSSSCNSKHSGGSSSSSVASSSLALSTYPQIQHQQQEGATGVGAYSIPSHVPQMEPYPYYFLQLLPYRRRRRYPPYSLQQHRHLKGFRHVDVATMRYFLLLLATVFCLSFFVAYTASRFPPRNAVINQPNPVATAERRMSQQHQQQQQEAVLWPLSVPRQTSVDAFARYSQQAPPCPCRHSDKGRRRPAPRPANRRSLDHHYHHQVSAPVAPPTLGHVAEQRVAVAGTRQGPASPKSNTKNNHILGQQQQSQHRMVWPPPQQLQQQQRQQRQAARHVAASPTIAHGSWSVHPVPRLDAAHQQEILQQPQRQFSLDSLWGHGLNHPVMNDSIQMTMTTSDASTVADDDIDHHDRVRMQAQQSKEHPAIDMTDSERGEDSGGDNDLGEQDEVEEFYDAEGDIDFTLVTQLSTDRLWMMQYHCQRWHHAISMVVYVEQDSEWDAESESDRKDAIWQELIEPLQCRPEQIVAMQTISERDYPAEEYPVNLLRNMALAAVRTTHVVYLDVDFWPSSQLYDTLSIHKTALAENPYLALVVPAFQLNRQCADWRDCREQNLPAMPETKASLMQAVVEQAASSFDPTNDGGHGSTRYIDWLDQESDELIPISCVRSNRYEPYLVFRYCRNVPPFQERFTGYGKNKMTWVMQLRRSGYELQQVGGQAFCVHYPHLDSKARMHWNGGPDGMQLNKKQVLQLQRQQLQQLLQGSGMQLKHHYEGVLRKNVVHSGPNLLRKQDQPKVVTPQVDEHSHLHQQQGTAGADESDYGFWLNFKRGRVDQTFVEFRTWLQETIPDRTVVGKCSEHPGNGTTTIMIGIADDDNKLWIPPQPPPPPPAAAAATTTTHEIVGLTTTMHAPQELLPNRQYRVRRKDIVAGGM